MPRAFTYSGPACNLGRFGVIKPGDTVNLLLNEESGIADDPHFTPILPVKPLPEVPLCARTRFDLREVSWDQKNLQNWIGQQYKGTYLYSLAQALVDIGCPLIVMEHEHWEHTVDNIVREAVRNGWHLMDREARRACPAYDDAVPEVTEEDWEDATPAEMAAREKAEAVEKVPKTPISIPDKKDAAKKGKRKRPAPAMPAMPVRRR